MSVEFYRGSPRKFDSRTLSRETLSRWTGRTASAAAGGLELRGRLAAPQDGVLNEGLLLLLLLPLLLLLLLILLLLLLYHSYYYYCYYYYYYY